MHFDQRMNRMGRNGDGQQRPKVQVSSPVAVDVRRLAGKKRKLSDSSLKLGPPRHLVGYA